MSTSGTIYGVQPVIEALRAGRSIDRIFMARASGGQTQRVRELAKEAGVPVVEATKNDLTKRAGTDRHQGVVAIANTNEVRAVEVEDMLETAREQNEDALLLLLDGIQDPQNLGAILRSAHALGAHGVVIPKHRSAQVTGAVVRASAGAALHVPIARVTNLKHVFEMLTAEGVWTAAAVMDGLPADEARLDGPLALVIGGEAKGVRPSLAEKCDLRVGIPLARGFDSLNASVAAGILMYEAHRQRRRGKA